MSPNSCLNSFYCLGDPVMDWECWLSGSSSFLLCPCLADVGLRRPGGRSAPCVFVACSSCSCSSLFSIRRGFKFWLGKVSDGPRVPGGQSAGAWRTVRVLPTDVPLFAVRLWRFYCLFQTVRGSGRMVRGKVRAVRDTLPDSPPRLAGQSTTAWQLCFLVRFLPSSFLLPRVLQGIVPKTWGWSITLLSWRLVCDSIHRWCVTGICLGYRSGSSRRIFTGSYSLPPSLVAIRSFSKSRSCFALGQANDLEEAHVGKGLIFTNHVDKARIIKKVMPKRVAR
jgi:hypothetical protein